MSSRVKYVSFVPLDNQGSYRFRLNYATSGTLTKGLTTREKRQLLAQSLRDALSFVEGEQEMVETGFSGFGKVNVWMEGA